MLQLETEQSLKFEDSTAKRRRVYVMGVDPADLQSPVTDQEGGQPTYSKNGGSFSNTTNTLVHVDNGIYYVELTESEVNELGKLVVYYNSGDVVPHQTICSVEADPFDEGYPVMTVAMGYSYTG